MRSSIQTPGRSTPRRHRLTPMARAAAVLLAAPLWLQAQTLPSVLPTGLQIVHGQASVATQGAQMTVRNSANAILNWQSFSIGAANRVHFDQVNAASKVLNRVTGPDPSAIFGSLTSNGQVWLLNPHGVLFGAGARVDVAGLVTSTLRLNDNDFLQGRYSFSAVDGDRAGVRNEGTLTSSFGGQIVLLGSQVDNTGSVQAPGGNVTLAAARSVELVDTGLPNLRVKVDVPAGEVLNLGRLAAAGGTIDVYGGIVNQQGYIQADTLGSDAQGRVLLHAADTLTLGTASRTGAQGTEAGATGGQVDLLGPQVGVLGQALVDVSGAAGGGSIRLGGGLQGRDTSVPNARAVYFGPEATLRADASGDAGTGGRIVLWSDEATRAYGTLSARGGARAGDGGFVETSGGWLDARPLAVNLAAPGGRAGTWLLDPNNISITDAGPDTNISGGPSFTSTNDGSVISTATIAAALNAGTSVTVSTAAAGSNLQAGDILVDNATLNVNPSSAVGLTLNAARDIRVRNTTIATTGAALSLELVSAGSGIGAIEFADATITTGGGNVTLRGAVSQQLPLPDGSFTAALYTPAVGYIAGQQPIASTLLIPGRAINLRRNTAFNLGSGSFTAVGYSPVEFGFGSNASAALPVSVRAANISITGAASSTGFTNGTPDGIGIAILTDVDLIATNSLTLTGSGQRGVFVSQGGRLTLNAPGNAAATLALDGFGRDQGVALWDFALNPSPTFRGTPVSVVGGRFTVDGRTTGSGPGVEVSGSVQGTVTGVPTAPSLDLATAAGLRLSDNSAASAGLVLEQVRVAGPAGNVTLNGPDIGIYDSLFTLSPSAPASWTLQSQRDIVFSGSTLTSSGSAVSLDLRAAASGLGAVELLNSSITTAGGSVTLGGSIAQQLPLPGGGFTAASYRPAVGYTVLTGNPSITSSGGNNAVAIYDSTLNLGSGNLSATGLTTVDDRDAVTIGTNAGTTVINAGRIDLVGYASVPTPVGTDVGVWVGGNGTDVTATAGIAIEGGGRIGAAIGDGARVALNAAVGSGAVFRLIGYGSDDAGVGILSDDFNLGTGGRGTRITVNNASFDVTGNSLSNYAVAMFNNNFVPGPLLDLTNASSATFIGLTGGAESVSLNDVELRLVRNGATRFEGNATVALNATALQGDGGSLSFASRGQGLVNSTITSVGAALAVDFATTGANPTGLLLENTILTTGGGDVRFGAVQNVSSSVLGATASPAPWLETTVDNFNYIGNSIPAALMLVGSTIDAGSGRVHGGGAVRNGAAFTAGVTLDASIVRAREITLAGRSEEEIGVYVLGGTYAASRVFTLDGLSTAGGGLQVLAGSSLRLNDPTASAGSKMSLLGRALGGGGTGVALSAGAAGGAGETVIAVDGAELLIDGLTTAGQGLLATGQSAAPGGLLINALGATSVTVNATNQASTGNTLELGYMNLLGPQNSASSPLNITATGGALSGTPSSSLTGVTLTSGGPVNILTDGLLVTGSRLGSDTRLALQTDTGVGGRAAAPIAVTSSTLEVSGAGAELRLEGSEGDNVRGMAGYNAGQGVTLTDSTLTAGGAGARLVVNGRGSDSGGTGVVVVRSTLTAANMNLVGRGIVDGDGVWMQDSTNTTLTTLNASNLTISGQGADTAATQTHVGVLMGNATVVNLSGRGVATIRGDTVLLGNPAGAQPLIVSGDAASFTVDSTGSQRVVNSTLDFSAGAGTNVTLQADSDASLAGRARLQASTVRTGGGNLTISGVGIYTLDPQGGALPFNQTVAEGAFGVMLSGTNTLEAGSGTVTMTGRSASDGRPDVPSTGGSVGVGVNGGTTTVSAGSIVLSGHGGDKGAGVDVGVAIPGSVLNLQATSISVTGQGVGNDPATGLPYPGVAVDSASSWNAGSGTLSVVSTGGGTALTGLGLAAGTLTLNSSGALTLSGSTLAATGALTASASGAPINGSLFSMASSTLNAGAALSLSATANAPGVALSLLDAVSITGGSVTLAGTASGAAGNAPGILASAFTGNLTATAGPLTLTGRNPALDTEGILLEGGWALSAPSVINLTSDGTTLLRTLSTFSPTFSAAQSVNLTLNSPTGITLGGAASALDAGTLATAVAGLAPTATLVLTVPDASGLSVAAPFSLPAKLQLRAEQIDFAATGSLTSTAPGDALLLTGVGSNTVARFDNQAGPGALSAPNGRWVLQLTDPASANLGGLGGDFTAYNLSTTPWALDASGNLITPAAGNAIGYAVAPAAVSGTALAGLLTKVYDAGTGLTLDPLSWTINGLVAGDTLTLSGASTATLADKNVGSAKPVTLNPASVFTVLDAGGRPVFGYELPVFTANVTPATLTVVGAAAASKVYDGNTAAALGAGSVTPLGSDVVALGTATGSFIDKNVGTAKAVTLSALTLTGADAGNYTLVQPTGLTADITPLTLTVTGLVAVSKVYDASTAAALSGTATIGAIAGDSVLLAGSAAASFADKNVGTAKVVTASGYSLSGADAGNYTLAPPAGLTADITVLPLPLTGLSATAKVYDGTLVAPLTGTAGIAPLAGDSVTLAGTAAGSFGDKNVGAGKLVGLSGLTLAGADAGNYQLALPVGLNASITPAALTLAGVSVAGKVYDASTAASATAGLSGVVAGDTVTLALVASFADANVGAAKTVSYTATPGGADAANYTLVGASGSTTADITPATLSYLATPLSAQAGSLPLLTGSVTGFVGGETLAGATSGTLAWTTPATAGSPPGSYAITGSGLAALNYQFVQAAGNATALTLSVAPTVDPITAANSLALALGLQSVQVAMAMSSPTEGRVLDVTPAFALGGADGREGEGLSFRPMNFGLMTRDEAQSLLAARASYKKKIFAGSLSRLEQDPALADVRPCKTELELQEGNCLITEALKQQIQEIAARAVVKPRKPDRRKIKQAVLPNIERKLALLIGINKYRDPRVPELEGSLRDTRAVRALLESRLGYETTLVEDASREAMIRAFNKLALDADANDSVVIYYAGHGDVVPVKGEDVGYWIPSDANADNPATWMSNADIARLVGAVGARQLMLISDSCFSGTLVGSEKVQLSQSTDAAELLKRKAAVVMSSGGNEPVADEGREGHSFFAWHFMRAIEGLDNWQVGGGVFERVRAAVVKDFPQTPHYGASRSAGHQGNTDYLFERREFEQAVPVPVSSPVPR